MHLQPVTVNVFCLFKDGKIFNELVRGNDSRKRFFDRIIEVVTLLGGDSTNVF